MRWQVPVLLFSAVGILATPVPMDLDVGVPPGSPISWGKRFPAITPGGPLFPKTGPRNQPKSDKDEDGRRVAPTVAGRRVAEMDVRIATSFGVIRIITWDLANHLTWVSRKRPDSKGPITGGGGRGRALPFVNDGLYWANMASLLRLLLHPQLVSEKEMVAHLVEIGEPVLAVLDNTISERGLEPISEMLDKMIPRSRTAATPLPGKTPRERMLKRFLAEELVSSYAYDPQAGFGRRFMLWADEIESYLVGYLKHRDSFLRRNAAAALARFRSLVSMRALADVAAKTKDPVMLMRALSGISGYTNLRHEGVQARLKGTKNQIYRVALISAVGRMGDPAVVPRLVGIGSRTRDPDMLQAVLSALLRIRHGSDSADVRQFARKTAARAKANPESYRVKYSGRLRPDVPDGAKLRGEVIEQLAQLLHVRVDPKNKKARAFVLGLLTKGKKPVKPKGPARPGVRRRRAPRFANNAMRRVHPPVQLLFLEQLRQLGTDGVAGLRAIAKDKTTEPSVRGHAMGQLPFLDRGPIVEKIVEDKKESYETKIYAFEILANDGHDRIEEIGRTLLKRCKSAAAGSGSPEQRYLWLQVLRALGKRGLLETEDLLPLLKHVEVRKILKDEINQRVRTMVLGLVDDAASGTPIARLRKQIDAIVDLVIAHNVNTSITADRRKEARQEIEKRLDGLKGHKGDRRYKNLIAGDILNYLLGFKMGFTLRDRAQIKPVVMLEEEILFALGRTKTEEAGEALVEFLTDHPKNPIRSHACLAVGMTGQVAAARGLLPLLEDKDGFVRFCAYESLRNLTGKKFWADWMYGKPAERDAAAAEYREDRKALMRGLAVGLGAGFLALNFVLGCAIAPEPAGTSFKNPIWKRIDQPSVVACGGCHQDVYEEWSKSLHHGAWTNANVLTATKNFTRTTCRACHSPMPVLTNGLDKRPKYRDFNQEDGVHCLSCHGLENGVAASRTIDAPCRPRYEPRLLTANACYPCHEPTHQAFAEYRTSNAFAVGVRCVDCHMQPTQHRRGRSHGPNGGLNPDFVKRALRWRCWLENGVVHVELRNRCGHKFPGEIPSRSFLVRVTFPGHDASQVLLRKSFRSEDRKDNRLLPDETRVLRFPLPQGATSAKVKLLFKPLPLMPIEAAFVLGSWSSD